MDFKPTEYQIIDFDSDEAGNIARKNMQEKKCLYDIYREQYEKMMQLNQKFLEGEGKFLEIGSGGGFMKALYPDVITTDVRRIDGVDFEMDELKWAPLL